MSIEAFLLKAQLRWVGHIMRMPDSRIPMQVFFGQLAVGKRPQCGPAMRYKDALKVSMKQFDIDPPSLSSDAQDRSAWRELCATKQSLSSKIRESRLWNRNEQFASRGFSLAATSAPGHVTTATASAAPELDSALINKLIDDRRSLASDGAVHSKPSQSVLLFKTHTLFLKVGPSFFVQ